jgi:hypothetical protein
VKRDEKNSSMAFHALWFFSTHSTENHSFSSYFCTMLHL